MNLTTGLSKCRLSIRIIPVLATIVLIFLSSCKDEPPLVSISEPSNDEVFLQGTDVNISVTADDNDGTLFTKAGIKNVQFFVDDELLFKDETSPYSYLWNTYGVSLGNHTLSTTTTDTGDNQVQEDVQVKINDAPTCSITNPGSIVYTETSVEIEATASDQFGGVSHVEFYLDNSLLSTDYDAPYSYTWNIGSLASGYYTIKVTAVDIYDEEYSYESQVEVKIEYIIGTWEGEYSGYDYNLSSTVEFRRHLVVNNDKTYENYLYGLPSGYSSDIVFEQESGTWETNVAGDQVSWTPTICKHMDISNPGTLVDWDRGSHYEAIILNAAFDQWSVRDETVSVDYYIKKQ
jgi:hypothetical protein